MSEVARRKGKKEMGKSVQLKPQGKAVLTATQKETALTQPCHGRSAAYMVLWLLSLFPLRIFLKLCKI